MKSASHENFEKSTIEQKKMPAQIKRKDSCIFPVSNSVLCPLALEEELIQRYHFKKRPSCHLRIRSVNDFYMISDGTTRYALRAARSGWRTALECNFETNLLKKLSLAGFPAPNPIPLKKGGFTFNLMAPEGERVLVLFDWVDGIPQRENLNLEGALELGKIIAKFHGFNQGIDLSEYTSLRIPRDLSNYLPLLSEILRYRKSEGKLVVRTIERLQEIYPQIKIETHSQGICHGDVHPGNALERNDTTLTLLDFDSCGVWYQVFDVASYLWSVDLFDLGINYKTKFLEGYNYIKPITQEEIELFPLFKLIRDAWHLAVWASNEKTIGCGWFSNNKLDFRMNLFKKLAKDAHLDCPVN